MAEIVAFNDVRKGDSIRVISEQNDRKTMWEGVVGSIVHATDGDRKLFTPSGLLLVGDTAVCDIELLNRPAPVEPTETGAIVEFELVDGGVKNIVHGIRVASPDLATSPWDVFDAPNDWDTLWSWEEITSIGSRVRVVYYRASDWLALAN